MPQRKSDSGLQSRGFKGHVLKNIGHCHTKDTEQATVPVGWHLLGRRYSLTRRKNAPDQTWLNLRHIQRQTNADDSPWGTCKETVRLRGSTITGADAVLEVHAPRQARGPPLTPSPVTTKRPCSRGGGGMYSGGNLCPRHLAPDYIK